MYNSKVFVFITSMDELLTPYVTDYYISNVIYYDKNIIGAHDDDHSTSTKLFRIYFYDENHIRISKEALHILLLGDGIYTTQHGTFTSYLRYDNIT
jgi:hypothetical protein